MENSSPPLLTNWFKSQGRPISPRCRILFGSITHWNVAQIIQFVSFLSVTVLDTWFFSEFFWLSHCLPLWTHWKAAFGTWSQICLCWLFRSSPMTYFWLDFGHRSYSTKTVCSNVQSGVGCRIERKFGDRFKLFCFVKYVFRIKSLNIGFSKSRVLENWGLIKNSLKTLSEKISIL